MGEEASRRGVGVHSTELSWGMAWGPCACFFVFLWFLYVLLSSLKAYEFI